MTRITFACVLIVSIFSGACAGAHGNPAPSGGVSQEAIAKLDRTLKDEIAQGGPPGTVNLVYQPPGGAFPGQRHA